MCAVAWSNPLNVCRVGGQLPRGSQQLLAGVSMSSRLLSSSSRDSPASGGRFA